MCVYLVNPVGGVWNDRFQPRSTVRRLRCRPASPGSYRIDVSGTYTNRDLNVADAEYTSRLDSWVTHSRATTLTRSFLGEGFGDVQVNGNFVDWGA